MTSVFYTICRDLYLAAKPLFPIFISVIFAVIILAFVSKLFGKDFRELYRGFIQEMNDTATRKKNPGAMNFIFGVLIFLVFVAAELTGTIHAVFVRGHEDNWVKYLCFGVLLAIFFLLSLVATADRSKK